MHLSALLLTYSGAGNEVRTRDPNHGKVMLYQLSYSRVHQTGANYNEIFHLCNTFLKNPVLPHPPNLHKGA